MTEEYSADRRTELLCSTLALSGFSPLMTSRHPSCLYFSSWRWHRPDAANEQLFVLPYARTCNCFLKILPNFALCQQSHMFPQRKVWQVTRNAVFWASVGKIPHFTQINTLCFILLSLLFFVCLWFSAKQNFERIWETLTCKI